MLFVVVKRIGPVHTKDIGENTQERISVMIDIYYFRVLTLYIQTILYINILIFVLI